MSADAHAAPVASGVLDAVRGRHSMSKVTDVAPTRAQLLPLVSAAGRVADHSSLRPWRLIELRGADRERLGRAIAKAEGDKKPSTKPLRAPLLIAVVASYRKSKVPRWEQEAVASGVAHMLSLLLDDAGWGVFWRTGSYTRSKAVAKAHGLKKDEVLLGWLYVGGKPPRARPSRRKAVDAPAHLSRMPRPDALAKSSADEHPPSTADLDAKPATAKAVPKQAKAVPKQAKVTKPEGKKASKKKTSKKAAKRKNALERDDAAQ